MERIKIVDIIENHDSEGLRKWLEDGNDPNIKTGYGVSKISLLEHVMHEIDEPYDDEIIIRMVNILIEFGANVNNSDDSYTPLFLAVKEGRPQIAEILLKEGAEFDFRDECGDTPLTVAALNDDTETVKAILKYADKETINKWGTFMAATPLGIAFSNVNLPMIEILLKHGADPYIPDCDMGQTINHIPADTDPETLEVIKELVEKYSPK